MYGLELYLTFTYFSFCGYQLCFVFSFDYLVGICIRISNFAVDLKICAITTGIKNYKPIIKKNKKEHDKVILLGK